MDCVFSLPGNPSLLQIIIKKFKSIFYIFTRPSKANKIVELYKQKAIQNQSKEMLPIEKCILHDIDMSTKTMEIIITHVSKDFLNIP